MEAVPRLPMISFELKTSTEQTSFQAKLKDYIRYHYNEDADTFNNQINQMEGLRATACRPPRDVSGCSAVKRYYCQLHFLISRFPMGRNGDAAVKFSWKDPYSDVVVSIADINLELASVLYNIGALHSYLGATDNRTTPDGMKMACSHFQCAAWAFQNVREEFPQIIHYDTSSDLLLFMNQLSLAQAQECILEKSMLDNRKATNIAKVAAQTVEYYKQSLKLLNVNSSDDASIKETIGSKLSKKWEKYVKFKIAYHGCVGFLYQGQSAEEQRKMGERVAYYQVAFEKLEEAQKLAKGLDNIEAINEALQFTNDVVEGKRKAAKNENELIYHEAVPAANLLPEVKGASLVKGIAFSVNDLDVSGPDIFGRLIPLKAHETSSIYSEKLAELQRKTTAAVLKREEELETFLATLNLDELYAREELWLPQELVDRCAGLSAKPNAIQNLLDAMKSLSDTYQDVESMLTEIRERLHKEEEAVLDYEVVVGKRPPSITATDLTREANKYYDAHNKAADSNQTLHEAMSMHIPNLRLLSLPLNDLRTQMPSVTLDSPEDEAALKEMQNLMNKVKEMKTQRGMLIGQLREALNRDDITHLVVTFTGENKEELFEQEIKKHEKQVNLIKQNLTAQDKILHAIQDCYARYSAARKNIAEKLQRREVMVASLKGSYDAYEDLILKSQKGLDFYKKLHSNVGKLLQRVRSTCKVQEEEREQVLANILEDVPRGSRNDDSETTPLAPNNTMPRIVSMPASKTSIEMKRNNLEATPSAGGGLKLKDYLNIKKETGKMPLVTGNSTGYMSGSVSQPYDVNTWVPEIRPAPLGSEENEPPKQTFSDSDSLKKFGEAAKGKSLPYYADQGYMYPTTSYQFPASGANNAAPFTPYNNQYLAYDQNGQSYGTRTHSVGGDLNAPLSTQNYNAQGPLSVSSDSAYTSKSTGYPVATVAPSSFNNEHYSAYPPNSQSYYPNACPTPEIASYQPYSIANLTPNSYNVPPQEQYDINASMYTSPSLGYGSGSNIPAAYANSSNLTAYVSPTVYNSGTNTTGFGNQPTAAVQPNNHVSYDPNVAPTTYLATGPSALNSYAPISSNGIITTPGAALTTLASTKEATPLGNIQASPYGYETYAYDQATYGAQGFYQADNSMTPSNVYQQPLNASVAAEASSQNSFQTPVSQVVDPYQNPWNSYTPSQGGQGNPTEYLQSASLYTQTPQAYDYTSTTSEVYNTVPRTLDLKQDGSSPAMQSPHDKFIPQPGCPSETQSPMTYRQAGFENMGNSTCTTPSSSSGSKPLSSIKASNVDLLAGLDLNISQSPLKPESFEFQPQTSPVKTVTASTSSASSSAAAAAAAATPIAPVSASIKKELKEEKKILTAEMLTAFVQEVERFEEFVSGLTTKTLNGPTPLDLKWKTISELQEKDGQNRSISVARCYPMKNRFPHILPYDDSRVQLPSTKDDYVNASYVKAISSGMPPLIITQAPLPVTYVEFWTMVMEQQVEVVVCLLGDSELEGHVYWPIQKGSEMELGRLRLTLQTTNTRTHWVERVLSLTSAETKVQRIIVHLQFTAWPGSSMPASPAPFLSFVQEAKTFFQQQRNGSHPAIIHCFSGVGRSGLFALILNVITDVQNDAAIPDIVSLIVRLSQSRKNCLRDREHVKFAYEAVLYFCQDFLMRRGILATRSSFEGKRNKDGKTHTRHPSEDFLVPSDIDQLRANLENTDLGSKKDRTSRGSSMASSGRNSPSFQLGASAKVSPGKQKITTESFNKAGTTINTPAITDTDPLSSLDPLWSLKK